jgi:oligopeptide/dipeptide ABC transporter ATP-binding protein
VLLTRDRRTAIRSADRQSDRGDSAAGLSVSSFGLAVPGRVGPIDLVHDVDLELAKGQVLGLVGESGSGKTTLVRSIAGFFPRHASLHGSISVGRTAIVGNAAADPRTYRGRQISMISQDPRQALNPSMRVGAQIAEAVRNASGCEAKQANRQARELLERVRISDAAHRAKQYPFELSGGMRQRIAIAIALACRPELLLADEPTTALDVTTQLQIIRLLKELQQDTGMAVVLVSHDLALVDLISDVIAVMYAGTVVEYGPSDRILRAPRMRYTAALVDCSLSRPEHGSGSLETIEGDPPTPNNRPAGCAFAARCTAALDECREMTPVRTAFEDDSWARCWHPIEGPRPLGLPEGNDQQGASAVAGRGHDHVR